MTPDRARRIIVIRDIPSNIVEEAILVLKSDKVLKDYKSTVDMPGGRKRESGFLIKEAEMIINNCLKEGKLQGEIDKKPGRRPDWLSNKKAVNFVINTAMIGGLALLILIITRMA